jgi:hypothetical protein
VPLVLLVLSLQTTPVLNALREHSPHQITLPHVNNVLVELSLKWVLSVVSHVFLEAHPSTEAHTVPFALPEALFPITLALNVLQELSLHQKALPHVLIAPLVLTQMKPTPPHVILAQLGPHPLKEAQAVLSVPLVPSSRTTIAHPAKPEHSLLQICPPHVPLALLVTSPWKEAQVVLLAPMEPMQSTAPHVLLALTVTSLNLVKLNVLPAQSVPTLTHLTSLLVLHALLDLLPLCLQEAPTVPLVLLDLMNKTTSVTNAMQELTLDLEITLVLNALLEHSLDPLLVNVPTVLLELSPLLEPQFVPTAQLVPLLKMPFVLFAPQEPSLKLVLLNVLLALLDTSLKLIPPPVLFAQLVLHLSKEVLVVWPV